MERSRSGKGAHVWLFFAEAIPATVARKLGCHILTETMEHRPDIGMDSYDRFFPNQDTLPQGGFGNLIALPLQRRARDLGNSVFVNEALIPYEDQWAFLSNLRKMQREEVETVVRGAEAKGRVVGAHRQAREEEDATAATMLKTNFGVLSATYDYADLGVPMLERMFNRRCQGYEAVGYRILLPASAIPGWPAEVPLPVDPAWKADYAGSVKRLIRDGVDLPLAHLFVQVASFLPTELEGADRARSATERFLFRIFE